MPMYLLNLREHFIPWELPTLPEISASLTAKYPSDGTITVLKPKSVDMGRYRISMQINSQVPISIPLKASGRETMFTLQPIATPSTFAEVSRNSNQSKGTLYTLYNCTQGPWSDIDNKYFDDIMSQYGTLTKPVEHQKHKGQTTYNGNRYCVMETDKAVPDQIPIPDPANKELTYMVRVGYRGKQYYCGRCQLYHVGNCPSKEEFYKEKQYKASQTINTQIFADSTLRHADDTGLSANITCMSGGRLGQISHMINDLPGIRSKNNIIMVSGINDICKEDEDVNTFIETVEKGLDTIHTSTFGRDTTVTMVTTPLPTTATPLQQTKSTQLDKILTERSNIALSNVKYIPPPNNIEMNGIHPTVEGTVALLKAIDKILPIIHNDRCISNPRFYDGVEAVYRYGCLHCNRFMHLNQDSLCPRCMRATHPATEDQTLVIDEVVHSANTSDNTSAPELTEVEMKGDQDRAFKRPNDKPMSSIPVKTTKKGNGNGKKHKTSNGHS